MDSSSCRESNYPGAAIDPDHEIRVLHLLPGDFQDAIHCRLRTQSIDCCGKSEDSPRTYDSPPALPYDALSYAWGDKNRRRSVYFSEDEELLVTENLWNALRRLRSTTTTKRLWVDQLCINQNCTYERSLQVSHMDCIYRHAGNVLIWLGDSGRQDNTPPKSHRRMYKQLEEAILNTEPSWWTRAWVVPEFVMAKHQRIFCFGTCTLAYQDFKELFFSQTIIRCISFRSFRAMTIFDHLMAFVQLAETEDIKRMVHRLCILGLTDCTDPKDKVYSLLTLMTDEEKALIHPEYDLSLAAVYAEATFAWVAAPKNLSALVLVHAIGSQSRADLPTWAIDFRLLRPGSTRLWPLRRLHLEECQDWVAKQGSDLPYDGFALDEKMTTPWCRTNPWCDAVVDFYPERLTLTITALAFDRVALSVDVERYSTPISWMQELTAPTKTWSFYGLAERSVHETIMQWINEGNPYKILEAQQHDHDSTVDPGKRIRASERVSIDIISRLLREWDKANGEENHPFSIFPIARWAASLFHGVTLFVTQAGFIGLGPPGIEHGDQIVLPYGSRHPICLRRVEGKEELWDFQGLTYVHGIMEGELLTKLPDVSLEEKAFVLR